MLPKTYTHTSLRCPVYEEIAMSVVSALILAAQTLAPNNVVIAPATNKAPVIARSCRFGAGLVDGRDSALPTAIEGKRFRNFAAIAAFRKASQVGQIIVIEGGDLSNQTVGAVDLSGVCFRGTRLVNTVWKGTKGLGIGFINADLTGARFDKVAFDSVLFRNTTLANVNAQGARLVFGQIDGGWNASMANLNLDNAQMIGFRFVCGITATDGCPFDRKQITMRGTDLSEAKLSSFAFWDTTFIDAKLNKTEISFDQISQFEGAKINGPLLVRAGRRTATISPFDFITLRTKMKTPIVDNCASPATPLLRVLCAPSPDELVRLHRDIEMLYRGSGASSTKFAAEQRIYLATLAACISNNEATARDCLTKEINERHDILIAEMLREKPLERGGKALYVSNDTPYVDVGGDTPALAPLFAASAQSYMLVRRDKGRSLNIRASTSDASGDRCTVFDSIKSKSTSGLALRIWATGADFKVGDDERKNQRSNQCPAKAQSGPLVRVPVSDTDFELLWDATETG
jgi:uncharacterized protein YjbI with pentapeptide repeats